MSVEFSTVSERRAREPHMCDDCRTTIKAGSSYLDFRWVSDGRWWRGKSCHPCYALRGKILSDDGVPEDVELKEYVIGYHSKKEIKEDELLSGFLQRLEQSEARK